MSYGDEYGELEYGEALSAQNPPDLLLYQTRLGTNFRALIQILTDRHTALRDLMTDAMEGFDLTNGEGAQLDVIGAKLGLPRYGASDERYRALLRIQALIVLSSTASADTIQRVVYEFTGAWPVDYVNQPPAAFLVSAYVEPDDTAQLVEFLSKAKGGGIGMQFAALDEGYLLVDEVADPIPSPGLIDEVATPVANAGLIATIYEG